MKTKTVHGLGVVCVWFGGREEEAGSRHDTTWNDFEEGSVVWQTSLSSCVSVTLGCRNTDFIAAIVPRRKRESSIVQTCTAGSRRSHQHICAP